MRLRRALIAVVAGLGLGMTLSAQPAPADAVEGIATYPLVQKATDAGVQTVIVQAPRKAWGLRKAATYIDARVNGLAINARPWARCRSDATCIRVTKGQFGTHPTFMCPGVIWSGCSNIGGPDPHIYLNRTVGIPKGSTVGCHELLHALGLYHHTLGGCLDAAHPTTLPSDVEIQALQELYP